MNESEVIRLYNPLKEEEKEFHFEGVELDHIAEVVQKLGRHSVVFLRCTHPIQYLTLKLMPRGNRMFFRCPDCYAEIFLHKGTHKDHLALWGGCRGCENTFASFLRGDIYFLLPWV